MAIESTRLVLNEVSRAEEALNYVPLASILWEDGRWGVVSDTGRFVPAGGPAVMGTVVAYLDPTIGASQVAVLYAYVATEYHFVYVGDSTTPQYVPLRKEWAPIDMDWPKIDPNTGKYNNINLIDTDPDYVNPILR